MIEIHTHERQQFKELFKQDKIDRFEDRYRILEAFLQTEQHVTVNSLWLILKEKKISLASEFIEETLELMCRFGFAQKNRF